MITPINLGDSSWGSYSLKLRISTNDLQISPLELMKFARWFHSGPPAHPHGPTHRTDPQHVLGRTQNGLHRNPWCPWAAWKDPPFFHVFHLGPFSKIQSSTNPREVTVKFIISSLGLEIANHRQALREFDEKNPLTTPNFCAWLALHLDQPVPAPAYRCFRENMRNRAISGLVFVPYVIYCNVM